MFSRNGLTRQVEYKSSHNSREKKKKFFMISYFRVTFQRH